MSLFGLTPIFAATVVESAINQLPVQPAPRTLLGMRLSDMLLLVGVALLIAVALIIWAVFIRGPKDERSERNYHSRKYVEERDDGTIRKRKKHRRRRRDHRQRNPTLAEVGGLPPLKSDSTSPPI
jgi:hypothetical protein